MNSHSYRSDPLIINSSIEVGHLFYGPTNDIHTGHMPDRVDEAVNAQQYYAQHSAEWLGSKPLGALGSLQKCPLHTQLRNSLNLSCGVTPQRKYSIHGVEVGLYPVSQERGPNQSHMLTPRALAWSTCGYGESECTRWFYSQTHCPAATKRTYLWSSVSPSVRHCSVRGIYRLDDALNIRSISC